MARIGKGPEFTPEEDLQIVRLRAMRYSYPAIAKKSLTKRSVRSIQSRAHRLEKSGEAAEIRRILLERGAATHGL